MKLHVEDNNTASLSVADPDGTSLRVGDVVNIGTRSYEQLTDKPTLEGVELDGDMTLDDVNAYTQTEVDTLLQGKANVSDIPEVPTNVSAFQNDAGYITDAGVTSFNGSSGDVTYTPPVTKVNNKTGAVTLGASDVGALPDTTPIPTVPTNISAFNNDAGYLTSETDPTVPSWAKAANKPSYTASEVGALPSDTAIPSKTSDLQNDSLFARGHVACFHGTCSTAAGTAEKAVTCDDFTSADLVAGAMIIVDFSTANSAAVADLKLNVNSTGAYAIKQNGSGTLSNLGDKSYLKASAYPFIFNGTYWITWYDTNTNTIGYTVRTNGLTLPVKTACYRYRICFTSANGEYYIPANASTSTSATASKTVTTEKIDPHGRIIYYSYTTAISANGTIGVAYQMEQYNGVTLGYSFNRTNVALTMTANKPVYVKCTPQTDGSAIIDSTTPFVQALPTTNDGYIYIFIGVATSATAIEFTLQHPVYYHDGTALRKWTGPVS